MNPKIRILFMVANLVSIILLTACNGELINDDNDDYDPDWAKKIFDKLLAPEVTFEFL